MTKPSQKHLTLSDRIFIEQGILQAMTFKAIAEQLGKDPSSISKEVRRTVYQLPAPLQRKVCTLCIKHLECQRRHVCGKPCCSYLCRICREKDPSRSCDQYEPFTCERTSRPPYVCNGCEKQPKCLLDQQFYSAKKAQALYEKNLKASRQGIQLSDGELQALDELLSPLVLRGQPLSHIFVNHEAEIPCCRKTIYNYFSQGVFKARDIDLPRRVRYKKRRKKRRPTGMSQKYRTGRTYADFKLYMEAHPELDVVEMDTVKGRAEAGPCLLTMLFRKSSFMLVFLLPDCTQTSVQTVFDKLKETLTPAAFLKIFPLILTDNGSEFKNPNALESDAAGGKCTNVFYCDPYMPGQKGRLEKNHEYIRLVIPKGSSIQGYTQEDIALMTSHINSISRDSLGGHPPYDIAELLLDKRIPALTGLQKVSPDNVMLKPKLLKQTHDFPSEVMDYE